MVHCEHFTLIHVLRPTPCCLISSDGTSFLQACQAAGRLSACISMTTHSTAHASAQVSAPQKKPEREVDVHAKQVRMSAAQGLLLAS